MKNKRTKAFNKTALIYIGCMVLCLIICATVVWPSISGGNKDIDRDVSKDGPKLWDVIDGSTPVFLADNRDDVTSLMEAWESGDIVAVEVSADRGRAKSEKSSEIKDVYKELKNIMLTDECKDIPSSAEKVEFTLSDGSRCTFDFAGKSVYTSLDKKYSIDDSESKLWELIDSMTEE